MNLFTNENGLFQRCFGFLGKLIAINFIWMLCSLPIITIGASTTAMYYAVLKLHKYGDCSIKDYFQSFCRNIRQAIGVWLLLIGFAGIISLKKSEVLSIPLILTALYIFPIIAAFKNKTRVLLANAFYFAIKNILITVCIAAISIFPMFFTMADAKLFPVYLFVWILCGFALTAYVNSWFFYKIFRPYSGGEKEDAVSNVQQYIS